MIGYNEIIGPIRVLTNVGSLVGPGAAALVRPRYRETTDSTMDRIALILPDAKSHRHSLNALVGALETDRELDALELRLPKGEVQLAAHIAEVLASGKRPVVGLSFTTPQLWHRRDLLLRLKARLDDAPNRSQVLWIAGGPHPTADPEGTLRGRGDS